VHAILKVDVVIIDIGFAFGFFYLILHDVSKDLH